MMRDEFVDEDWFAAHPERRAVERRNYNAFRRGGYSVDESFEASRAIEIDKWIEERDKTHNSAQQRKAEGPPMTSQDRQEQLKRDIEAFEAWCRRVQKQETGDENEDAPDEPFEDREAWEHRYGQ